MVDFEIDEDYKILIANPEVVKATFDVFQSMDDRLFSNVLHLRFLLDFREIHALYFVTVFEKELWGVQKAQQRFEQCIKIVREQLPVAFTSLLIRRFTNKKMIDDAYEIANRTMEIIIKDVENDETLPYGDKRYLLLKLRSLKLILGYPEEILDHRNVVNIYKELDLTGRESFLELNLKTFIFSKKQDFKNFIETNANGFAKDETKRWIDYTTEDELITPVYIPDTKNIICKIKKIYTL